MSDRHIAVIVLAAGLGTRMKSAKPKVMHPLAGRPMVRHLLETVEQLEPEKIVCVIGEDMDGVRETVAPVPCVIQKERLGTGHAVLAAEKTLAGFSGDILILYGDSPLISFETLSAHKTARAAGHAVAVLGFDAEEPGAYGRLIMNASDTLEAIIEAKDATPEQAAISFCNSGVMMADSEVLWKLLNRVGNDNAKGEYYLTDIVALARADGLTCAAVEGDEYELVGINDRVELALAETLVQAHLRMRAMVGGATLTDPETVYFSYDTKIGQDVVIGPHVVFGPGVTIEDNVEIRAYSHIEAAHVKPGAIIGPFARLRPGADIGPDVHIGNFVEVKNAVIEEGAKANHLAYIGDARVGAGANIGAGTITCNYDGYFKTHTDIGAGAFIGSNTALVAPVKIGDGASIGAGSVITKDVAADSLALERSEQKELAGAAKKIRERKAAKKAKSKN
ncbi:MAG: bifunctional UDP-N-acetylglucosamine diphosphorylase/glucosamine-1-phosphate N-acetyltransferase GlmU [Rhodospirillaceae bacterium]|jgi:bifunctional UDP-N-acetylglucosamine pyrophosphorylase/glucosamine-1-phosphate N-acetyltransferase